jgi:glycosyltransferase involved in cell wall biosynthesis
LASHCETLVRGLKKSGWDVVLITGPVDHSHTRTLALGSIVQEWFVLPSFNPTWPSATAVREVRRLVEKHRIKLFHAHGFRILLFARLLQEIAGVPIVATYHPSMQFLPENIVSKAPARPAAGNYDIYQRYQFPQLYYLYLRLLSPKMFIALSSDIEQFLRSKLAIPQKKIRKIVAGVDTSYFVPPTEADRKRARSEFSAGEDELICVLVGRLNWNKGHDVLVRAVRSLRRICPELRLRCLFSGSGEQESQIREFAYQDGDDRRVFTFVGHVEDLRTLYYAADVLVLPSRVEGFALVVAEAMCCGVIPVRTPSGGAVDQIIDGKTGFITPFDDSYALARTILRLRDTRLRAKMSKECTEYGASMFSHERMVHSIADLYAEICAA